MAARIRKGDEVVVISGRDKGQRGTVLRVMPDEGRALVSNVHMVVRHYRPTQSQHGGKVRKEAPIHLSNLALADPGDDKPTRVGFRLLEDGRKVRFARRSGEVLD